MRYLRSGYEGLGGHLGTTRGEGLEGRFWGHSEVQSEVNLRSILRNLINSPEKAFIWPWVGPWPQIYVKYGSWDGCGLVPGIAPLQPPTRTHYPGYTLPPLPYLGDATALPHGHTAE